MTDVKKQSQTTELKSQNQAEKEPKKNNVNEAEYSKFIGLKFLESGGNILKKETTDEMNELEKKLKTYNGPIPLETVNAAIGNENVKLVKGVPVPGSIEKIVVDAKSAKYYFEK